MHPDGTLIRTEEDDYKILSFASVSFFFIEICLCNDPLTFSAESTEI